MKTGVLMILTIFLSAAVLPGLSAAAPLSPLEWKEFILENEKIFNEIFLKEYEIVEENFSDRRDENGKPISIRDFIRPEETKELIAEIGLNGLAIGQKVKKIHFFVRQNFQFVPDEEDQDYWQYPAETIKRGKGDCEDLAFLLVSILIEAGIPEEFIRVNIKNWHAYASVEVEGEILILETDPNPEHFYLYDWPQYKWNRQIIEKRKRK